MISRSNKQKLFPIIYHVTKITNITQFFSRHFIFGFTRKFFETKGLSKEKCCSIITRQNKDEKNKTKKQNITSSNTCHGAWA